jgi:hypothetical protein
MTIPLCTVNQSALRHLRNTLSYWITLPAKLLRYPATKVRALANALEGSESAKSFSEGGSSPIGPIAAYAEVLRARESNHGCGDIGLNVYCS